METTHKALDLAASLPSYPQELDPYNPAETFNVTLVHEHGDGTVTRYSTSTQDAWSHDYNAYDHLAAQFESTTESSTCYYEETA